MKTARNRRTVEYEQFDGTLKSAQNIILSLRGIKEDKSNYTGKENNVLIFYTEDFGCLQFTSEQVSSITNNWHIKKNDFVIVAKKGTDKHSIYVMKSKDFISKYEETSHFAYGMQDLSKCCASSDKYNRLQEALCATIPASSLERTWMNYLTKGHPHLIEDEPHEVEGHYIRQLNSDGTVMNYFDRETLKLLRSELIEKPVKLTIESGSFSTPYKAVRVTKENIKKVAEWCNDVEVEYGIKTMGVCASADVGDWVVLTDCKYEIYTNEDYIKMKDYGEGKLEDEF